ncbi:MAG: multidrug efflux system membrane fusion protein [Candidatus Azotimanducaceae bacterium]|jgi:multidrug efflux system membrane fusion protein
MWNKRKMVGVLALSLLIVACSEELEEEISVRNVRLMTVGITSHDTRRSFNGRAETDRVVNLSFRSTGFITLFDIKLGQQVEKGQLLAELDNVSARLAYEQTVSSLNSAKSVVDTEQSNLKRIQSLYEKGGRSLSEYESAKNAFRTANASYLSAQRSVEIQQEQIRYGKIFSPEGGVIAAVNKEIDENISAGETIAILNAGTDMEIQVGLPESMINQVQELTQVSVSFAAIPGALFNGEVSEVSPSIDRQTATYPIRIRLLESTEQIKSGMAANVNFNFTNESQSAEELRVPASAVGEDATGRFVFTVERSSGQTAIVRKRSVEIGELIDSTFVIKSGLQAGDQIITAGVHSVLDGQKVSVL